MGMEVERRRMGNHDKGEVEMNDAEKNKILRELRAVTTSGEVVRVVPTPREHKGQMIDYVSLYVDGERRFVGELKYAKYFFEA